MDSRIDIKNRKLQKGETQLADGRYRYRYTDDNGERHDVYSWRLLPSDKNPEDKEPCDSLRQKEQEITELLSRGINPAISAKTTLNDLYDQFKDRTDVRPTTLAVYQNSYERQARTTIGCCSLDELTYVVMLKYYQSILPCSKSTLRIASAMPTYLLNVAIKNDIITKNVSSLAFEDVIKSGADSVKTVNALTEREERELLKYLKAHIQEKQNFLEFRPNITLCIAPFALHIVVKMRIFFCFFLWF